MNRIQQALDKSEKLLTLCVDMNIETKTQLEFIIGILKLYAVIINDTNVLPDDVENAIKDIENFYTKLLVN